MILRGGRGVASLLWAERFAARIRAALHARVTQLTAGFSSLEGAIVQPVPFAYGAMSLGYRF